MGTMVPEHDATALAPLLEKVYRGGGHDFRGCQRGTGMRHLERRLHATGTRPYWAYMKFLNVHPEEYQRLAISKQVIAMQGGKIWAESEPDKGSTVTFILPKKKVASP